MAQQSDTVTDQPKVFISYRRDEPGNYAGPIYRAIRDHFGLDPAGATLPPPYAH